jgi:hypothetical protein
MQAFISLFCDDIREERSGADTIVGVYPDNLSLPHIPSVIPKFGIYTRLYFEKSENTPKIIAAHLKLSWSDEIINIGDFGGIQLQNAFDEADKDKRKRVGIIMKAMLAGFAVTKTGSIDVILNIDGKEVVSGSVRIVSPDNQ